MSPIISEEHVGALARLRGARCKMTLLMTEDDGRTVEILTNLTFYFRLVRFKPQAGIPAGFTMDDVKSWLK